MGGWSQLYSDNDRLGDTGAMRLLIAGYLALTYRLGRRQGRRPALRDDAEVDGRGSS